MSESPAALVLGATGGVGTALVRRLAGDGWRVAVAGRDAARADALAAEVGGVPVVVDARDVHAVEAAAAAAAAAFGRLDAVADCVGSLLLKPAHATSVEEWDEVVATNLTSAFGAVRAGARHLGPDGGSVVLVSSAAAGYGMPNHEAIAAAKAGVAGLTVSAAASYASRGIRVNAVAPGLVETPLTERLRGGDASRAASLAMHALGRFGTPDDVAAAMAFLAGADSGWITGQVLGVDGGLSSVRPRPAPARARPSAAEPPGPTRRPLSRPG